MVLLSCKTEEFYHRYHHSTLASMGETEYFSNDMNDYLDLVLQLSCRLGDKLSDGLVHFDGLDMAMFERNYSFVVRLAISEYIKYLQNLGMFLCFML